MQKIERQVKWSLSVVVMLVTTLVLFIGQPFIMTASADAAKNTAAPLPLTSGSSENWPKYSPPPRVDPLTDPADHGDMVYQGGPIIDGIANIYLTFWIDAKFQAPTPQYVSLIGQFINDFGQSPVYANLLQYHDAKGHSPTGARLAGIFTDTRPFPPSLVIARGQLESNPDKFDETTDPMWHQELVYVAAKQHWNTKDIHNLFILLPVMNLDGCSFSDSFNGTKAHLGSPYSVISYPFYNGQIQKSCVEDISQSPNPDQIADIAIHELSHELPQAIINPLENGWTSPEMKDSTGNNGGGSSSNASSEQSTYTLEISERCEDNSPKTIDPRTHGNVVWKGHTYLVTEQYDNFRHGCVLEGP